MAPNPDTRQKKTPPRSRESLWDGKFKMFMIFNASLLVTILAYIMHLRQLERDVITPLDAPKMVVKEGLEAPDRYWGSYRSQLYFGMKNRNPDPVNFGLMWFNQKPRGNSLNIRHWCSQRDNLKKYTWLKHDGLNFGEQIILDGDLNITTSFVKRTGLKAGGEWTARITVNQLESTRKAEPMSLFFYSMADIGSHNLSLNLVDSSVVSMSGQSPEVGSWRVRFEESGTPPISHNFLSTVVPAPDEIIDVIQRSVRAVKLDSHPVKLFFTRGQMFASEDIDKKPNFVLTQVTVVPPYTMEVIFENSVNDPGRDLETDLHGDLYTSELRRYASNFDQKFDKIFPLNQPEEDKSAAKAALSNMVGSIGYFFGQSLVKGPENKDLALYWNAPLYTAVPSRSFFPRGFLWDEGFHNLLITRWNPEISKDIVGHWLDLMNKNGWIPREQILGDEARAVVPNEFIVQRSTNANPPTLFLTVELMLDMMKRGEMSEDIELIKRAYPRLERIYRYFREEQNGKDASTFRWRGRDPEIRTELNPKTLASGLDDYPRASHPTEDERHVDLRCWVALMARVLSEIGERVRMPESVYGRYTKDYEELRDNSALIRDHWSEETKQFSDYGLHTDNVMLVGQRSNPGEPPLPMVRYTRTAPELRFVSEFGYVSLFPMMMKILDSDSKQLGEILRKLDDPNLLWTNFGLRSLSKSSKLFESRNTEHDPPYWRGNIWINMNFMVISSLKHYSRVEGPHAARAKELHDKLKSNVVKNVLGEYRRTGFFWENYKADTGKGHGCHPFTGWTALVVLIMGDQY